MASIFSCTAGEKQGNTTAFWPITEVRYSPMRVSETKKQREEPPPPNLANSDLAVLVETLEYDISLYRSQVTLGRLPCHPSRV